MYRIKGKLELQTNVHNLQTLVSTIRDGKIDDVKNLLTHFSMINEFDAQCNQTPLMVAAGCGQTEIVRLLINDYGADISIEDRDGWTALTFAIASRNEAAACIIIDAGCEVVGHLDRNQWTPLMWACYMGFTVAVHKLLEKGADPSHRDCYLAPCIVWAAGRGHCTVINELLDHGAQVNAADRFGTSSLLWAARAGHVEACKCLIENGADVEAAGMYTLTPLLASVKSKKIEIVKLLLKYDVKLNIRDINGITPLCYASKQGNVEMVEALLNNDANPNFCDRSNISPLIYAVRGLHSEVAQMLLEKNAKADVVCPDGRSALLVAVEKGCEKLATVLLRANADPNCRNPDTGDTPLIRAAKQRLPRLVTLLLRHHASAEIANFNGDTALHVAVEARTSIIVEILLRDPTHGRLLYVRNNNGLSPYSIDRAQKKNSVLSTVYGENQLHTEANNHGYYLYSAALADLLADPGLNMPLTLGMFAKWGSGKSFLLEGLTKDMSQFNMPFMRSASWPLYLFVFIPCFVISLTLFSAAQSIIWLIVAGAVLALPLLLSIFLYLSTKQFAILRRFGTYCHLIFCLCFYRPQSAGRRDLPVRFLFTGQSRVSSIGGEASIARLVASLAAYAETEYGVFATRLHLASRESPGGIGLRMACCIPLIGIFVVMLLLLVLSSSFSLALFTHTMWKIPKNWESYSVLGTSVFLTFFFMLVFVPWVFRLAFQTSQQRRLLGLAEKCSTMPIEKFVQRLKREVDTLVSMAASMDAFCGMQSRMVVTVDGLDSCEQEKVLRVLETVTMLFCSPGSPFVIILALDPSIIVQSIEQNVQSVFRNSNIKGYDYLHNLVHLPFYLPDKSAEAVLIKQLDLVRVTVDHPMRRTLSQQTVASVMANHMYGGSQYNISDLIGSKDYLNDLNPRSMRRLANIIGLVARLMRAHNINVDWARLTLWLYMSDRWPKHTSLIIYWTLQKARDLSTSTTLKAFYERMTSISNMSSNISEECTSFETFLYTHSPSLTIGDLREMVRFSCNLDPNLKLSVGVQAEHSVTTSREEHPSEPLVISQRSDSLNALSAEEVAGQIPSVKGLSTAHVANYQSRIVDNNISGQVLGMCDLEELKSVLEMRYGDWLIFKQWVTQVHRREMVKPWLHPRLPDCVELDRSVSVQRYVNQHSIRDLDDVSFEDGSLNGNIPSNVSTGYSSNEDINFNSMEVLSSDEKSKEAVTSSNVSQQNSKTDVSSTRMRSSLKGRNVTDSQHMLRVSFKEYYEKSVPLLQSKQRAQSVFFKSPHSIVSSIFRSVSVPVLFKEGSDKESVHLPLLLDSTPLQGAVTDTFNV